MPELTLATPRRPAAGGLGRISPATGLLIVLLAVAAVVLLYVGRHLTFTADEWGWAEVRRGGGLSSYLQPYNDHFSLFPLAVYRLFFALFGMRHYTPYRAADVALHLLCASLLYIITRRRLGPWLALVPTTLLLFMGTASQDLLWGFQIGFLGSVAGGLGALALIEDRRSDLAASALLVWSIASSGVGLAFLVASLVALVARRDPWRRLWIVGVPALIFVLWYVGWGHSEPVTTRALLGMPSFVAAAAAAVGTGMAGLGTAFGTTPVSPWGPAIIVGALIAFSFSWRRWVGGSPTPMLLAAVAGALTFWVLAAVARASSDQPGVSRYLYIGAIFVWLIAAEVRLGSGLERGWLGLAALLAIGALIGNLSFLRTGEEGLRELSDNVRASLTATEVAAPIVAPQFIPYPVQAPEIKAGLYLAAERDLGSPAFTVAELLRAPFSLRLRADQSLQGAERIAVRPVGAKLGCRARPSAASVQAAPGTTVVLHNAGTTSAMLYLRRFASAFTPPVFAKLPPRSTRSVRFPADRAPTLPWELKAVPARHVGACLG